MADTIKVFSPSFKGSFFFVSQKTSSICTKERGSSWALGTIYCLKCITELLYIFFCLQRIGFHQPFAQSGVLHISEPSLNFLIHVWICSLTRYWAVITEVFLVFFWCFSSRSPWISSSFSWNQSWCLRDTGPRESIAKEWTVSLKTVQFSSGSFELCSCASKRLQISLMNACLLQLCFSLETSNLFGTFLPCDRRAGWMHRLSLLKTSLWSVQPSAPHIVFVTPTSCLSILRTMT